MSDGHEHPDEHASEALSPDLHDLDAHLLEVGARWRAASPEVGAIAGRLRERAGQMTAEQATSRAAAAEPAPTSHLRTISAPAALHGEGRMRHLPLRRARGLVAALAAVAVVGALAALLLSASPARTSLESHGPATATTAFPPVKHGEWTTLDKLDVAAEFAANDLPAIAPSNPQVVYETMVRGIQQHQAGSLRRTDDGGATWHDLPIPIPAAHVGHAGMMVSPLDPRTVFLTLISTDAADCPANRVQQMSESTSGGVLCWLPFTSTDGGAHWTATPLPLAGGTVPGFLTGGLMTNSTGGIQAGSARGRGTRLYSGYLCAGAAGFSCVRLVTSADGGASWQFADAPLLAAGAKMLCDYAASSTSGEVYAVTSPAGSCWVRDQAALTMWRSVDDGAHWSRSGNLLTPDERGMALAWRRDTGQSLLYAGQPTTVSTATDKMGGKYAVVSAVPADVKVSADGGASWTSAPNAGIPTGLKPYFDIGLLGTLSDGSVVVEFIPQTREENFGGSTLFAWKPGDAAWRQLAPPVTWEAGALLVRPTAVAGQDTLYLVMVERGGGSASHPTFSFLRYDP